MFCEGKAQGRGEEMSLGSDVRRYLGRCPGSPRNPFDVPISLFASEAYIGKTALKGVLFIYCIFVFG